MTNTNRIATTEIVINRAEGPHALCREVRFAGPDCWSAAERHLVAASATAPDGRACDKCDVTVTFADGFAYSGRYELRDEGFTALAEQVRQAWNFYAGRGVNERQAHALEMMQVDRAQWGSRCDAYQISA